VRCDHPLSKKDKTMNKTLRFSAMALAMGMAFNCLSGNAQERDEFNPHLFMQLQGGVGHTVGETSWDKLLSPAAAAYVGYDFSPIFLARIGASGWQGEGYLGRSEVRGYEWNYAQANLDALFDLGNLLGGFRSDRTLNPYLLAGVGANLSFNQDGKVKGNVDKFSDLDFVWTDNEAFLAGRLGLGIDIRLSKVLYLNLEANTNILPNKYNGKSSDNVDWQSNLVAGLTFHFGGKGHKSRTAPEVEAVEVPAPAPTKTPEPEPETVAESTPALAPAEFEEIILPVLFPIDKHVISETDLQRLAELAEKVNAAQVPVKVRISGYADKDTGTASRNQFLSEKRADAVRNALVEAGVSPDIIETKAYGSTVNPYDTPEANRVAVVVAYAQP